MSKHRRAAKVDANQKQIMDDLIRIPGVSVTPGHDDIFVGYKGQNYWYEIKNPDEISKEGEPYKRSRTTYRKQKELSENWTGHYRIVWQLSQILEDLGL